MFELALLHVETYNINTLGIKDISLYNTLIYNPKITICIPGFGEKTFDFLPNSLNIIDSTKLGITEIGCEQELPDGIYVYNYCMNKSIVLNSEKFCVQKKIFRMNKLQEKFDNVFLKLDISECNNSLKKQEMLKLQEINVFIQAILAASNSCSEKQALELYKKANSMLDKFKNSECNCN